MLLKLPPRAHSDSQVAKIDYVLAISKVTGDVLADAGFELFIPTANLGDALTPRKPEGGAERYVFDCDTGAMILLTVAEVLSVPATLVEITLPSGNGHNYVRWHVDAETYVDWDTNGRAQCTTPADLPRFEGVAMSRDQTMAYVLMLRATLWERQASYAKAVKDYRSAMALAPDHPGGYNGFAWSVATKPLAERDALKDEALAAANRAVALSRTPNYLDTLACAYAFAGDFERARTYAQEAVKGAPSKQEFAERAAQFGASPPRDCTGAE